MTVGFLDLIFASKEDERRKKVTDAQVKVRRSNRGLFEGLDIAIQETEEDARKIRKERDV